MWIGLATAAGILIVVESLLLVGIQLSIGHYAKYWRGVAIEGPQQHALNYVVLGDSTGQGIGATSPERSYPALLAGDLAKKYNRPVHIVNLSVSGATAQDVLDKQIPEFKALSFTPDFVTMEVGANDVPNLNPESFEQTINAILSQLPANSYVSDLPYFGGRSFFLQPKVEQASSIIREAVLAHNLRQVNLLENTKAHNSISMYAADLFHPSNKAYEVWAMAFGEAVATNQHQYLAPL